MSGQAASRRAASGRAATARPPVVELAAELIARRSITPADAGCQELLFARLEPLGFRVERIEAGGVKNFWARLGTEGPVFAFAGHTDVVPPGREESWTSPPFEPQVRGGRLYGRGAADMKGGLAAMVVAVESFLAECPEPRGSLALLVTSAEERLYENGTPRVLERLEARGEKIDFCLVGEPSSREQTGDRLRIGRRGSLVGRMRLTGRQGHVAVLPGAQNAVHRALPALTELAGTDWGGGDEHFPPTAFHLVELAAGVGVSNVVPPEVAASLSFRYPAGVGEDELRARVAAVCERHGLAAELEWRSIGRPFLTSGGRLLEAVEAAIGEVAGLGTVDRSTGGGTSDGRFIAATGAQVVELGPPNATIHEVDESVATRDLEVLAAIYRRVLGRLLGPRAAGEAGA